MPVCRPVILSVCLLVVRLLVGQSVYPLIFPCVFPLGLSTCPPNGQTDLPPLSPPVVCHHSRLSVCLFINSLIGQAGCPSVFQCLCAFFCLPGGRSVLPFYLSARPSTLLFPLLIFLHVWSWVHSSPKPTSVCHGPGLAAPSEAEQTGQPAQEPLKPSSPPALQLQFPPPTTASTAQPLPSVGIHPLSPALECYRKI